MMLGKRKQTTAPWKKKGTLKKWPKKRSQFGPRQGDQGDNRNGQKIMVRSRS